MIGTLVVLVILLLAQLGVRIAALAATFFLARANGQRLKPVSWSRREYTAEFHDIKEPQSGNIEESGSRPEGRTSTCAGRLPARLAGSATEAA